MLTSRHDPPLREKAQLPRTAAGERGLQVGGKGASRSGGAKRPIRVQAEVLRDRRGCAVEGAKGFAFPEDCATGAALPEALERHWRQADVKRAIAAAEKAGLTSFRIEIAPDGTISIVVGAPSDAEDCSPR